MINDSVITTAHSPRAHRLEVEFERKMEATSLPASDSDIPHKKIKTQMDMIKFKKSKAFLIYDNFMKELNEATKSKPNPQDFSNASPLVFVILSFFDELEEFINLYPPVQIKDGQTSRFGNLAYRDWFDKMCSEADRMMDTLLNKALECSKSSKNLSSSRDGTTTSENEITPSSSSSSSPSSTSCENATSYYFTKEDWHRKELSAYWKDSFGNRTRIDYGTGHEATFCAWMCCLARLNIFSRKDSYHMVAVIFPRYVEVMRKILLVYKLEPAGSHGVWGLDDHQFLTYLWGSAQLINNPEDIKPSSIHDPQIIERYSDKYMYLAGIKFINQVKKGPFGEHSPLLNDISGVPRWMKINSGLIKMYYDEVLFKYVVIQHFLFGRLLPFELAEEKYPNSQTSHGTTSSTVVPTLSMPNLSEIHDMHSHQRHPHASSPYTPTVLPSSSSSSHPHMSTVPSLTLAPQSQFTTTTLRPPPLKSTTTSLRQSENKAQQEQ
ncbi:hypothetical protein FDP41_009975 [Naegleria fowleri]|uniref:Serine/threonine-protein phosphatase 2A activator n=1 Tax=Naegleria fowleri TaxID=5763 RepID=A0A6A5B966_NAEFO|nr:uncharacterized protein FDP41_009975 [Naegleria fowleri]KAF0971752.1 hypothetical protein FDP41_009975 [Naegleria fowleri]